MVIRARRSGGIPDLTCGARMIVRCACWAKAAAANPSTGRLKLRGKKPLVAGRILGWLAVLVLLNCRRGVRGGCRRENSNLLDRPAPLWLASLYHDDDDRSEQVSFIASVSSSSGSPESRLPPSSASWSLAPAFAFGLLPEPWHGFQQPPARTVASRQGRCRLAIVVRDLLHDGTVTIAAAGAGPSVQRAF